MDAQTGIQILKGLLMWKGSPKDKRNQNQTSNAKTISVLSEVPTYERTPVHRNFDLLHFLNTNDIIALKCQLTLPRNELLCQLLGGHR